MKEKKVRSRGAVLNGRGAVLIYPLRLGVQRGSLVLLSSALPDATEFVVVVSNNVQNESSDVLLVVPLQRRSSRLLAPFAVELGKAEGFRRPHIARCDWVTRIARGDVQGIVRASCSSEIMRRVGEALTVALALEQEQIGIRVESLSAFA